MGEHMLKTKAFTEEGLTAENARQIYNFLRHYHCDTDGWLLYRAAQDILHTDAWREFPAEDNLGYFEVLDGFGNLKRIEIAIFADKEYEELPGGYEKLRSYTLDTNSPEYQDYQKALWPAAVCNIIENLTQK